MPIPDDVDNARLRDAAPDMADALLAVRAWILRCHGPGDFQPFTQLKAALAKAGL